MDNEAIFVLGSREEKKACLDYIWGITSNGPVMQVTIGPYKRTRSLKQNRAYWGVWLKTISDATGFPPKAWHVYFKRVFIPHEAFEIDGKLIELEETTSNLTVEQFTMYLELIRNYASETLSIQLPELVGETG